MGMKCHSKRDCESIRMRVKHNHALLTKEKKVSEKVVSKVITEKVAESKSSVVSLSTGGRPLRISSKPTSTAGSFSHQNADELQLECNLSQRKLFKMFKVMRSVYGEKSVKSKIKESLQAKRDLFSDLFSSENCDFHDKNIINKEFVYCNDPTELIERVATLRNKSIHQLTYKVGFDSGKGVLKMTLNIYDEDELVSGGGDTYKDTGVKKTFIIASAEGVPENYNNCFTFISKCNLNSIVYTFAADLKMINHCLGLQNHASCHPCPYCDGTKGVWEGGRTRTVQSIQSNCHAYCAAEGKFKVAKNFNCVREPLLSGSEVHSLNGETLVLLLCPPTILHIKLGIVNSIVDAMLTLDPKLEDWFKKRFNLHRTDYHGKQYVGNDCNKILENLDVLRSKLSMVMIPYINALDAFHQVLNAISNFTAISNYQEVCSKFTSEIKSLHLHSFDMSHSTKVHMGCLHQKNPSPVSNKP